MLKYIKYKEWYYILDADQSSFCMGVALMIRPKIRETTSGGKIVAYRQEVWVSINDLMVF
jgi:hypothetical protein